MITVHRLGKRFGPVPAVDDLSFAAAPGSVTGFLGPTGSGKTTTLRILLGLVRPTTGEALIEGRPYQHLDHPARVVGAVLGAQGFHPARSARNHLRACAVAIGVPDSRVGYALDTVGLADVAGRRVGRFPLGMRQRLALAAALLGDPRVLVLDEPATGLDPQGTAWLRAFLRGFAAQGRTVLVSGHQLAEIEQTADRLVVIDRGRCVHQGGPAGLHGRPRVLVRCPTPVALAEALAAAGVLEIDHQPGHGLAVTGVAAGRIGDIARAAGVPVHGLHEQRVDLEHAFLNPTRWPSG
jgi:ABC-2 type transport system ATP-binding protein